MKLNLLKSRVPAGVMFLLLSFVPNNLFRLTLVAAAESDSSHCVPVGGALMTNIGAIAGVTNLGPASGDLAGSLAATILGQNSNGIYNVQHYWVTAAGETITFKKAVLTPTYPPSLSGTKSACSGLVAMLISPCSIGDAPAVAKRAEELKVTYVYLGQAKKTEAFEECMQKAGVTEEEVAYMGDDLPDIPLARRAGLARADPSFFVI
jgi:hypothetical protein